MSLYNMIHGVNPMSDLLLASLGLTRGDVGRFRDCYWNGEHICVYTRNGGGNREDYDDVFTVLQAHPNYVRDEDDDFDSTYATIYFDPHPAMREALKEVPAADATPKQKWESFFDRLRSGSNDPQIARVLETAKPLIEALTSRLTQA